MDEYSDIQTLLDLDGLHAYLNDGYWIKIDAARVESTAHIPHGIRYSLTLHDRNNTRVLGFDNAHGIKPPKRKKYSARKITWDHKHKYRKVEPYEFESSAGLLEDFWEAVDRMTGR